MNPDFSEANAQFALDLFRLLSRAHQYENIVFCPMNLISALGLLLYGSRTDTADEIEKILHFDELAESELPGYSEATQSYDDLGNRLRSHLSPHTSPTMVLPSDSVKHSGHPGSKEHKEGSPPSSPSDSKESNEPQWCPPCEQVPDYVCEKPEGVHTIVNKVLKELNEPSTDYELFFANRLFADESIHFFQKFLYCALKLYLTEVDRVDIHNATADVRKLINLWVEIRTYGLLKLGSPDVAGLQFPDKHGAPIRGLSQRSNPTGQGKIKKLLHEDSFNCEANMLLVNALYFKGQWEVQFDKELTKGVPFYFNEVKCKNVQMMYRRGQFNIGKIKGSEAQVLEIPYKNNKMSLFILLPKDCRIESLQQVEDELTHENLLNWGCLLKPQEVNVAIPKLSIEKRIEANTYYLPHLTDPDKADMSGATSTSRAVLTHLFHGAFLEIDEEGGEAPEEPQPAKGRHLARRQPVDFVANHPFIYYVLHKSTQSLLAFGQFTKPE